MTRNLIKKYFSKACAGWGHFILNLTNCHAIIKIRQLQRFLEDHAR